MRISESHSGIDSGQIEHPLSPSFSSIDEPAARCQTGRLAPQALRPYRDKLFSTNALKLSSIAIVRLPRYGK